MPELPEVETIVRDLKKHNLIGRTIKSVDVFWHRSVGAPEVALFSKQLINQEIKDIERRGKFIVIRLKNYSLLIHLRMTGKLIFSSKSILETKTSHERIRLNLDNGDFLQFEDQRKFGKWYLTNTPETILNELGLEPLSSAFTFIAFKKCLQNKSQQIKPFLLNQRYIAGLGNIYVDEALWEAKIHPLRRVNTLNDQDIKNLYKAIPKVLEQGVKYMGTTLGVLPANYFSVGGRRGSNQSRLKVFRREGLPCPRCQHLIIKITVGQRGTHFCPHCQIYSS